jgi:hypothetical protein
LRTCRLVNCASTSANSSSVSDTMRSRCSRNCCCIAPTYAAALGGVVVAPPASPQKHGSRYRGRQRLGRQMNGMLYYKYQNGLIIHNRGIAKNTNTINAPSTVELKFGFAFTKILGTTKKPHLSSGRLIGS